MYIKFVSTHHRENAPNILDIKYKLTHMELAFDVFQEDKSPLKELAPLNIAPMYITFDISQEDRSPLKELAPLNILLILVTLAVFQEDTSPLKELAPLNNPCKLFKKKNNTSCVQS